MVDLDLCPRFLALFGILDLCVEHVENAALHGVGRDEQLTKAYLLEWTVNELEDLCHLCDDRRSGRHHQIIGVDLGIALMEVAGANTCDVTLLAADI